MTENQIVWVAEQPGDYEPGHIIGIYTTADTAKAACQAEHDTSCRSYRREPAGLEWEPLRCRNGDGYEAFGSYSMHAVTRYEVQP